MPTHANNFVVKRALRAGGDSRFDEVKHQPCRFTFFWMTQGTFMSRPPQNLADSRHTATWVMIVGLPVYLVSVPPHAYMESSRCQALWHVRLKCLVNWYLTWRLLTSPSMSMSRLTPYPRHIIPGSDHLIISRPHCGQDPGFSKSVRKHVAHSERSPRNMSGPRGALSGRSPKNRLASCEGQQGA